MIPALQFGNAFVVQRSGNPKSPESLDTAALQLKDHIDGLGVDTFVRLGGDCGFRTMFTGPQAHLQRLNACYDDGIAPLEEVWEGFKEHAAQIATDMDISIEDAETLAFDMFAEKARGLWPEFLDYMLSTGLSDQAEVERWRPQFDNIISQLRQKYETENPDEKPLSKIVDEEWGGLIYDYEPEKLKTTRENCPASQLMIRRAGGLTWGGSPSYNEDDLPLAIAMGEFSVGEFEDFDYGTYSDVKIESFGEDFSDGEDDEDEDFPDNT